MSIGEKYWIKLWLLLRRRHYALNNAFHTGDKRAATAAERIFASQHLVPALQDGFGSVLSCFCNTGGLRREHVSSPSCYSHVVTNYQKHVIYRNPILPQFGAQAIQNQMS